VLPIQLNEAGPSGYGRDPALSRVSSRDKGRTDPHVPVKARANCIRKEHKAEAPCRRPRRAASAWRGFSGMARRCWPRQRTSSRRTIVYGGTRSGGSCDSLPTQSRNDPSEIRRAALRSGPYAQRSNTSPAYGVKKLQIAARSPSKYWLWPVFNITSPVLKSRTTRPDSIKTGP
jgi:hypothetical protein